MGFAVYPTAPEPDLDTDLLQLIHMELGTDIYKPAKSCPVSQSDLSALNQAAVVQEVDVSTSMLHKRKKEEFATLLLLPTACPHQGSSSRPTEATGPLKGASWKHPQSTARVKRSSGIPSPGIGTSRAKKKKTKPKPTNPQTQTNKQPPKTKTKKTQTKTNKQKECQRNKSKKKKFSFFAYILLFLCSLCSDSGPSHPLPWIWILGT